MNRVRGTALVALLAAILASVGGSAAAMGVGVGGGAFTLDPTAAVARAPAAVAAAVAAFEAGLIATGVPPLVVSDLVAELDAVADAVGDATDELLTGPQAPLLGLVPVPVVGVEAELDLPLVVVDTVRFAVSWMTESTIIAAVGLAGVDVPPLPYTVAEDGISVRVDPTLTTLWLMTEATKRLDLVVLGVELGVGVDAVFGSLRPGIEVTVSEFQEVVDDAVAALHLDGLGWSILAMHGTIGLEIGPPFLRAYLRGLGMLPVVGRQDPWWPITLGHLALKAGVVIRF